MSSVSSLTHWHTHNIPVFPALMDHGFCLLTVDILNTLSSKVLLFYKGGKANLLMWFWNNREVYRLAVYGCSRPQRGVVWQPVGTLHILYKHKWIWVWIFKRNQWHETKHLHLNHTITSCYKGWYALKLQWEAGMILRQNTKGVNTKNADLYNLIYYTLEAHSTH